MQMLESSQRTTSRYIEAAVDWFRASVAPFVNEAMVTAPWNIIDKNFKKYKRKKAIDS